jgi:hypothetical protein
MSAVESIEVFVWRLSLVKVKCRARLLSLRSGRGRVQNPSSRAPAQSTAARTMRSLISSIDSESLFTVRS